MSVRGTIDTQAPPSDRYRWVALSNTTLGTLMATLDSSIVIIALPAIFRGIHLDPLAPGNIAYLLWMVLGYLLVSAVLVVSLGRLGDMFGRVRMYNLGFLIFSIASLALSLDPFTGHAGALWLILLRVVQAAGGAMLTANSTAILTDAFPLDQRGMALGVNQIAGLAGQFLGLVAGGLLAVVDWRAVFWVNVPIGIIGTLWSYRSLRDNGVRRRARIDWAGNATFTLGAAAILAAITHGIQPYGGHATGWSNPVVLGGLAAGVVLMIAFGVIETRTAVPMFRLALFRIRAFAAGSLAALLVATARGGLQFMLIIWLQGIWLPLHGYDYADTPLWAGIYLLPLTAGFLLAGPVSGHLSDRHGTRTIATCGADPVDRFLPRIARVARELQLPGLRRAAHPQRHRTRHVLGPQHLGDHEQRARGAPRRGLRHACHVPELRHRTLHRCVLLPDDLGPGGITTGSAQQRTERPGCTRIYRCQCRPPTAGQHVVRGFPGQQPDPAPARTNRRTAHPARAQHRRPDGHTILPRSDLRTLPPRTRHRVHSGRSHGHHRRTRITPAGTAPQARRLRTRWPGSNGCQLPA
jgi:MFS family permease